MKQALRFLKLDFITVKPYLTGKNLLIIIMMPLLLMYFTDVGIGMMFFLMGYGALFVSYPFSVGEQNGIDALYATLSIKRKTAVLGRYLFALTADLFTCLVGFACTALIAVLKHTALDLGEFLVIACAGLVLFSLVQAIQLPLFFRFGHAKAKLLSMLPFMAVPVLVFLYEYLNKQQASAHLFAGVGAWVGANGTLAALLVTVFWLAAMFVSYDISCAVYKKRDF